MTDRLLKCRYCEWATKAWYTTRNGNKHSGMRRLLEHVHDEHTTSDHLRELASDQTLLFDTMGYDYD